MSRRSDIIEACLRDCTDEQREAIEHTSGPLLVLAGPGSGKTRVVTRRVAYLVASGCRPDEILAVTFTNKAAGEMAERIESLGVPAASPRAGGRGVWISTFHSFCARMLRIHARHVGLKPSFSIYDTADSVAVVRRAMDELEMDKGLIRPAYAAAVISRAKDALMPPSTLESAAIPHAPSIARIYEKYQQLLRMANAVDFDDLLLLMVELIKEEPSVSRTLAHRFTHVLIDEYQDTNHAQYVIARHLASGTRNICATGDPDQSIYGWRGADINNILRFEEDYPDAKVVRLEQNYRSTKKILRAADSLIANNVARKPKRLWTQNPEGDDITLIVCEDETDEAETIARSISDLIRSGEASPSDVAILYRMNAQSRAIEAALRREAIPYTIVAGTEFYQRKEVKDILAYLRLVENPADDVSIERVVNVPPRKVGAVTIQRLKAWAAPRGFTLMQAMERIEEAGLRGGAVKGIKEFLHILSQLRAMPRSPAADVVKAAVTLTEYTDHLLNTADNAEERIENVRELVNAAAEYDKKRPEGGLAGFLEEVSLVSDVDRWDESAGGVTLMTLHSAKGLEFPIVYVVGLEEGILPLTRNDDDHDIEEERRLFFVGLTRAKRRVTLSYAVCRTRYGRRGYSVPSRFLAELGDSLDGPSGRRLERGDGIEVVYDEEPGHEEDLTVGDMVEHPTYGHGRVLSVFGRGESRSAKISFPAHGVKLFRLRWTPLRRTRD